MIYLKEILSEKIDIEALEIGTQIEGCGTIEGPHTLAIIKRLIGKIQRRLKEPQIFVQGRPELIPKRQYYDDAGLDLKCAAEKVDIESGAKAIIPTGIKIAIPYGYEGDVRPRSGLTTRGIFAIPGTIDAGYRGEIQVVLFNTTRYPVSFKYGERIAQLIIRPIWTGDLIPAPMLPQDTERGSNGFGSTGK